MPTHRIAALPGLEPAKSAVHSVAVLCFVWVLAAILPAVAGAVDITVDALTDDGIEDGNCELAEAIRASHNDSPVDACPGGSAVEVDEIIISVPGTIALQSSPERIGDLRLQGLSDSQTTIDCTGVVGPVCLNLRPSSDTWIENLTILNSGQRTSIDFAGGSILEVNDATLNGGSALVLPSSASLILHRSTVVNFLTEDELSVSGGAILVDTGELRVYDSSLIDNAAFIGSAKSAGMTTDAMGGAIYCHNGSVEIVRTTLSGNRSEADRAWGGAITTVDCDLTIRHSTIVANRTVSHTEAGERGGGIDHPGFGDFTFGNSIIAGNVVEPPSGPDIPSDIDLGNQIVTSEGHNFVGTNRDSQLYLMPGTPNADGDYVGSVAAPLMPELEPLAENGGPTPTHLPSLSLTSLIVDRGSCSGELADQRGWLNLDTGTRPVDSPDHADDDDGCDIGAAEALAGSPDTLFVDGFESGDSSGWSTVVD